MRQRADAEIARRGFPGVGFFEIRRMPRRVIIIIYTGRTDTPLPGEAAKAPGCGSSSPVTLSPIHANTVMPRTMSRSAPMVHVPRRGWRARWRICRRFMIVVVGLLPYSAAVCRQRITLTAYARSTPNRRSSCLAGACAAGRRA